MSVCIKNVVCHILGSKSTSTINHSEAAARRVLRPATLLKKRLRTGVFLRILQNDYEHLFYITPPADCVWLFFAIIQPLRTINE